MEPDCPYAKPSAYANFTQLLTEFQKLCKLRLLTFGATWNREENAGKKIKEDSERKWMFPPIFASCPIHCLAPTVTLLVKECRW